MEMSAAVDDAIHAIVRVRVEEGAAAV
jgi:hypothetical protein